VEREVRKHVGAVTEVLVHVGPAQADSAAAVGNDTIDVDATTGGC
jgi:hypothetical protein